MLQNTTVDKLIAMRLTAMADLFKIQGQDPSMKELSFEDRFGLLVDAEYNRRKDNRLIIILAESWISRTSSALLPVTTSQSTGTSLLPVLQAVEKRILPVLSAWQPACTITRQCMSGFRICCWISRLPRMPRH